MNAHPVRLFPQIYDCSYHTYLHCISVKLRMVTESSTEFWNIVLFLTQAIWI